MSSLALIQSGKILVSVQYPVGSHLAEKEKKYNYLLTIESNGNDKALANSFD
jgi:hypothetical protein